MKKVVIGSLVGGLSVFLAPFVSAQQQASVQGNGGALGIEIHGKADLQFRYLNGTALAANGLDLKALAGSQAEAAWVGSPDVSLEIDAKLPENSMAVLELAVPRIDGGALVNTFGNGATLGRVGGAVPAGLTDSSGVELGVRQVYVQMNDFLSQGLNWKFGLQSLSYDAIRKGQPLAIGFRANGAESAWAESAPVTGPLGTFRDEVRPGGLVINWHTEGLDVDLFHMLISSIGSVSSDEMLTGAHMTWSADKDMKTRVEGLVALASGTGGANAGLLTRTDSTPADPVTSGHDAEVWILGFGVAFDDVMGHVPGLSLWGQGYFNTGTYGSGNGGVGGGATKDIDASGMAYDIGAQYTFDVSWKPTFGLEYLFVGGNDPSAAGTADTDYEGFVGYEDNDELAIIEDNEFGLDVDQNYRVLKVRSSVTGNLFSSSMQDSFSAELLVGFAWLDEDIANKTTGALTVNSLGTEVDLKVRQALSKQVSVYATMAWLFGSEVIEDSAAIASNDDMVFTWFIGTDVRF